MSIYVTIYIVKSRVRGSGVENGAVLSDEELVSLAGAVHTLARLSHVTAGRRAGVEMPPALDTAVLTHVMDHPGCRVQDVADALLLAPANASAAVTRLSRAGLVIKKADDRDRRVVRLEPSERAAAERERIDRSWLEIYRAGVDGLDDGEQLRLAQALPALVTLAAGVATAGAPADREVGLGGPRIPPPARG